MSWERRPRRTKRQLRDELLVRLAQRRRTSRSPYPWQRPHHHPTGWTGVCGPECADLPGLELGALDTWLLMGGRGTGKTDATSLYVLDHVAGPPCDPRLEGGHRVAIVAPTIGDAIESSVTGVSGLLAYDRRLTLTGGPAGHVVRWPNGARARLFGAHTPDDVNRLRSGGNTCLVVLEEAAAMRQLGPVRENATLGLRLGRTPHFVAATTPRVRNEVRELLADSTVHVTRGRTKDATALGSEYRDALEAKYAGTTLGRQEMGGELLTEVAGALWTRWLIDQHRVKVAPPLRLVVVGLDPNAGGEDEAGIVVVGIGAEPEPDAQGILAHHLYVLDDLSDKFRHPGQWARAALWAMDRWNAARITAEVNNGGNMVPTIIRNIDRSAHVQVVHASDGKAARAEPVVGLYEQGRVHHVGVFPKLEDQQTTWKPGDPDSPDRSDALVWATSDLALPRARRGGGRASAA